MIKKRKINAYDIVFLLLILAASFVIAVGVSHKESAPEKQMVQITFKIASAESPVASGIGRSEDFLIEDKFSATLVDFSSLPAKSVVLNEWGEYKRVKSAERVDIILTLTTECTEGEMGYLIDGLKYAVPNMTLRVSNSYVFSDAKIMKIEKVLQ